MFTKKRITTVIAVLTLSLLALSACGVPFGPPPDPELESRAQVPIYRNQGGSKLTVETGGEIEIQSGATLDIQSGATTDFSSGIDLDGGLLDLDADGDTSIQASTDDQIDIEISGADDFTITANVFTVAGGSSIRMDGNVFDLDADRDTSLTASTDDQIDVELGGADVITFTPWPAAAGSADIVDVTETAAIMDGSDALIGFDLNLTGADHTGSGNTLVGLDIDLTTADAQATETAIAIDDTDWDVGIAGAINLEHLGIPSVASAAVTYTSSGAIFTVTDGEIWLVTDVIINVTTNFDCTGDNCTVDVGDDTDTDGFLNMADADAQAAATEYTGAPAGWQGLEDDAPTGVFLSGGPHVYAPSGADQTVDIAVGGTDPAAGAGTVYIFYIRLQ
jgi:hypothetical protein